MQLDLNPGGGKGLIIGANQTVFGGWGGSPSSWGDHSQVLTHPQPLGHPGVLKREQLRAAPRHRDPPKGAG